MRGERAGQCKSGWLREGARAYFRCAIRSIGAPKTWSIGAIMEYGATITMPNGTTIVLPPRPFLHPTMEKYRDQVADNYRKAIRTALDGT